MSLETRKGIELLPHDGRAVLRDGFVRGDPYEAALRALDWREERVRIFGKMRAVPRLVAFYGDHSYSYSGIEHPARAMPDVLLDLKNQVEEVARFRLNSVLCNQYRHGQDSMGYHRDNEPKIDPGCIASLSFGAARRFKLRHRESRETITVELNDGSLLLMLDCQMHWEHALPKTKKPVGSRINLTFRQTRS